MKYRTNKTLLLFLLSLPALLWSQDPTSVTVDTDSVAVVESSTAVDSVLAEEVALVGDSPNTLSEDVSVASTQEDIPAQRPEGIVQSEGFSVVGLARGMLGMAVLILLSFVFSSNRKAIRWRNVGIGLFAQLVLAIGVLKVKFVQSAFELVSKLFVKTLEFTEAGSTFLLAI